MKNYPIVQMNHSIIGLKSIQSFITSKTLQYKHAPFKDKLLQFFKPHEMKLKRIRNTLKSFTTANLQASEAYYWVDLRIAQTKKPHTIGES